MLKVAAALILGLIFTGSSVQKESSAEHMFIAASAPEALEARRENEMPSKQSLKEQNIYAPLETRTADGAYKITGRIYLSDKRTAAKVEAASDTDIHIKGTVTRIEGDMKLIYEGRDGSTVILAESTVDSEQPVTIDTVLSVKAGTGNIYFSGASAVYDFDISFGLSDDIKYYLD